MNETMNSSQPIPTAPVAPAAFAPPNVAPVSLGDIPAVSGANRPWLVIGAVSAAFIAIMGSFIIFFMNASAKAQIRQAEEAIKQANTELNGPALSEANRQLQLLNGALAGYKTALGRQTDWSAFFTALPAVTPKDITINSLSVDDKGILHLAGQAPSFASAGKALLAFRQADFLSDVKLNSVGFGNKGGTAGSVITYDINATVKKAKFGQTGAGNANAPVLQTGSTPAGQAGPTVTNPNNSAGATGGATSGTTSGVGF